MSVVEIAFPNNISWHMEKPMTYHDLLFLALSNHRMNSQFHLNALAKVSSVSVGRISFRIADLWLFTLQWRLTRCKIACSGTVISEYKLRLIFLSPDSLKEHKPSKWADYKIWEIRTMWVPSRSFFHELYFQYHIVITFIHNWSSCSKLWRNTILMKL